MQITMAVAHTTAGGPAATLRVAAPSRGSGESRCYANHNGTSAHDRRGAQQRLRAPQPLLEALQRAVAMQITMAVAHTTAGGQRRLCAPQPLLEALERAVAMQITMAVAHTTAGGPSSDSARRSPF